MIVVTTILVMMLAAQGDPYVRCDVEDACGVHDVVLPAAQRIDLMAHIADQQEWGSIDLKSVVSFECEFELIHYPTRCRPQYRRTTMGGATIRDLLLSRKAWTPNASWLWKYYYDEELAALTRHVYEVAPSIKQSFVGLPLLSYVVRFYDNGVKLIANVGHKAIADTEWCAAHSGEILVPMGAVP